MKPLRAVLLSCRPQLLPSLVSLKVAFADKFIHHLPEPQSAGLMLDVMMASRLTDLPNDGDGGGHRLLVVAGGDRHSHSQVCGRLLDGQATNHVGVDVHHVQAQLGMLLQDGCQQAESIPMHAARITACWPLNATSLHSVPGL